MIHRCMFVLLGALLWCGTAVTHAQSPPLTTLLTQNKVACGVFKETFRIANASGELAKLEQKLWARARLTLQSCSGKKDDYQVTTRPDNRGEVNEALSD